MVKGARDDSRAPFIVVGVISNKILVNIKEFTRIEKKKLPWGPNEAFGFVWARFIAASLIFVYRTWHGGGVVWCGSSSLS